MSSLAYRSALPRKPAIRPFRWIDAVFRTHTHRERLARLEPHLQRDLGLTDAQIDAELNRPFWDIPNWWR